MTTRYETFVGLPPSKTISSSLPFLHDKFPVRHKQTSNRTYRSQSRQSAFESERRKDSKQRTLVDVVLVNIKPPNMPSKYQRAFPIRNSSYSYIDHHKANLRLSGVDVEDVYSLNRRHTASEKRGNVEILTGHKQAWKDTLHLKLPALQPVDDMERTFHMSYGQTRYQLWNKNKSDTLEYPLSLRFEDVKFEDIIKGKRFKIQFYKNHLGSMLSAEEMRALLSRKFPPAVPQGIKTCGRSETPEPVNRHVTQVEIKHLGKSKNDSSDTERRSSSQL